MALKRGLTTNNDSYTVPRKYLVHYQSRLTEPTFSVERSPTFFDSKRSPIHRWYGLVTGFSYASVIDALANNGIVKGSKVVLDPFVGCGTTVVTAKGIGIKSIGIEAHPLLAFIARTKTFWDFQNYDLNNERKRFLTRLREILCGDYTPKDDMPPFVRKLYARSTLKDLLTTKEIIAHVQDGHLRDIFSLALLRTLKDATYAKVDGIYIAPESKKKTRKGVIEAMEKNLSMMISDLLLVRRLRYAESTIIEGDCRDLAEIDDESIDFAFTSPPYLNNFDYAEMTRLELYFMGMAKTWRDITQNVRQRLLTNTTTQVTGSMRPTLKVDENLPTPVRRFIDRARSELSAIRPTKRGKKDYDIITVKYFNEMRQHFVEMYRVLRPHAKYVLTLGDSALYGVHIPTDELLRDIALGIGFGNGRIEVLRRRGQRSNIDIAKRKRVALREVRLHLTR